MHYNDDWLDYELNRPQPETWEASENRRMEAESDDLSWEADEDRRLESLL